MRIAVALLVSLATSALAAKPPPLGAPGGASEQPGGPDRVQPAPLPKGARVGASGSGFVVAPGRVVTNAHVARGCSAVLARNAAGRQARTKLLKSDPKRDLALLEVPRDFGPALTFRGDPPVLRGESVVTYGFPLSGLLSSGPTLTTGTVSALTGLRDTALNYTISAPVQPGNSGGPLLDAQGHVIGVIVAKLNAAEVAKVTGGDIPQNVNFAIKGNEVLDFLRGAGTTPTTAASRGPELRPSEIGTIANPATAFLQCLR